VPVGIELLTPREVEVLALIASGKSGREVAELLGISFKTVFVHRQKIYAKLQVHKVTDLIRIAMRMGLIEG
jgi:DNA-binding NarL/FixJ family response regulator